MPHLKYDLRTPTDIELTQFRCKFEALRVIALHTLKGNEPDFVEHEMGYSVAEAVWALGNELSEMCGVTWVDTEEKEGTAA